MPDAPKAASSPKRVIRDAEFAARLEQACDSHQYIPPKHSGRLSWIQRELERRFDMRVTVESISKWFMGESKPRPKKLEKLAELLEVDVAWLSLGVNPALQPREQRIRNAMVDGAVNLVAGLIQMDGGHPAFPEEAQHKNHVDLHAIIKGAKYDFHVSLAQERSGELRFTVPANYESMVVLGVVKRGFTIEIYEIPHEVIAEGGRRGGSVDVVSAGGEGLRRIESFAERV